MEFVGRAVTVTRRDLGGAVSSGTVRSYDASSGLFVVVFDGGDSEELGLSEVSAAAGGEGAGAELGRKPKKRRRLGEPGNGNVALNFSVDCEVLSETLENGGLNEVTEGNLEIGGKGNLKVGDDETLGRDREGMVNGDANKVGDLRNEFDLNAGFNLNLNEDLEFCSEEGNLRKRDHIDLNLDANGDFDEGLNSPVEIRRRKWKFDLNLEVVDDVKEDLDGDVGEEMKFGACVEDGEKKEVDEERFGEKVVEDVYLNGTLKKVDLDINEESSVRDVYVGSVEQLKNDCSVSGEYVRPGDSLVVLDTNSVGDQDLIDVEVKDGFLEAAGTLMVNEHLGNLGSPPSQRSSRRKRRKILDIEKTPMQTVLRRSARRGAARNRISEASCVVNDAPSSPAVSAITEEKPTTSAWKEPEKPSVSLPPKLQLPPSSQNLDLNDIPILDLFSVYACLRSFSTLLFLSPFEFDDFVAALKCKSPSSLLDNVHVSILQTLRKHLEFLSNEGSESASDCLRSLNWDFLDVITWPMFMVEYYLIHNSELKPRFDLSSLKLFKADYYQQPASIKVEMLRCLCDDLIEVEAIRSELNRRSLAAEPDMVLERNSKYHANKKRRTSVGVSSGSRFDDEVADDSVDWNYDECCLCKMDGSLICCDGCPAAYHSRCVGIASDHLPEGDWYCPECAIDRHKPWMKLRKSLRGAELLGIDPHGRLYFHSSGYLLVSDSYDAESSFSYYHKDDLNMVIEVLKSSDFFYGDILVAICKHWGNVNLNGTSNNINNLFSMSSTTLVKGQSPAVSNPLVPLASTETCAIQHGSDEEGKMEEKTNIGDSGLGSHVAKSINQSDAMPVTGSSLVTSEESAETPLNHTCSGIRCNLKNSGKTQNQPHMDCPFNAALDISQESKSEFVGPGNPSTSLITKKGTTLQEQCGIGYANYYSFGRIASSVAEGLMGKSSEKIKEDSVVTEEEITSRQMRIIVKKYSKFCWSNIQNVNADMQKEKCGWCFSCRAAIDDSECLFFMNVGPVKESSNSDVLSLESKKNKRSHLTDILCQILSIENRLRGLLLGPWLNPNHSKLWCRSAIKAFDMASVKQLLLTLQSNICPLALSAEWSKYGDSEISVGSASHIITSSARGSSKNMIGRKRPKGLDTEPGPTFNTSSGLGIFWWRGGRLSRKVFNWKVLPHSLVSKAARQAGCTKIPGILYPENSEYAKRSNNVAWQAAVETSTSAEQLAIQLRELDSNIRWDDIENTHPIPALDKEAKKSFRLFKKVIIRRKCIQGGLVKYLLDFGGKRRAIPDVVLKNGSLIEESSSDKKKYWLEESYVPLHLLKNFEEKRIARKSNDTKSEKLIEYGRVTKKPQQKKGFEYLFSKAERSEYCQCGHCSKDVLIREAVSCRHCKGFFHKRHVRKSAGSVLAECTYTCHRCHNGIRVRIETKKGKTNKRGVKLNSQKSKNVQTDLKSSRLKANKNVSTRGRKAKPKSNRKPIPAVPLRRSARKAKCLVLQKKKQRGRKKGKPVKSKKRTNKKPQKITSWRKKRTEAFCRYWLNGLQFSRKLNDERVLLFRSKSFLFPSEELSLTPNQPKCQLCNEAGHTSTLNYIACEICEEWFHADAIGVHSENIDNLTGFRCHNCCERDPPVCPHSAIVKFKSDMSQLVEIQNDSAAECAEEVSNAVPPLSEVACN